MCVRSFGPSFFFSDDPAPPEIYTLSLHDALPISVTMRPAAASNYRRRGRSTRNARLRLHRQRVLTSPWSGSGPVTGPDRKSTRLNSSHTVISYAVFCLKKKTTTQYSSTTVQYHTT